MKSNKGSVTLYVIIAMLTISAFLMAIYVRNTNAEKIQEQVTAKIKSVYEDYNLTEAYETIKNSKPEIKGYSIKDEKLTIETYTSNGINVDQNGKKILYYAVTTINTRPEDEQWQNNNVIDISRMEDEATIYLWIKNEDGIVSNEYEVTVTDLMTITVNKDSTLDSKRISYVYENEGLIYDIELSDGDSFEVPKGTQIHLGGWHLTTNGYLDALGLSSPCSLSDFETKISEDGNYEFTRPCLVFPATIPAYSINEGKTIEFTPGSTQSIEVNDDINITLYDFD